MSDCQWVSFLTCWQQCMVAVFTIVMSPACQIVWNFSSTLCKCRKAELKEHCLRREATQVWLELMDVAGTLNRHLNIQFPLHSVLIKSHFSSVSSFWWVSKSISASTSGSRRWISSNVNQSAQCGTVAGSLSMILHELFSVLHDTDVTYFVDVHVPLSFMPSAVSVPTVTCYLLTGICPWKTLLLDPDILVSRSSELGCFMLIFGFILSSLLKKLKVNVCFPSPMTWRRGQVDIEQKSSSVTLLRVQRQLPGDCQHLLPGKFVPWITRFSVQVRWNFIVLI